MNETNQAHGGHRPPEKRVHRTWFFWVALVLMLVALANYILTDDLAGWGFRPSRQPPSVTVGK